MLAAAPWSLAVFTLSLPFALLTSTQYGAMGWLFLALALVNLIAFARMTFAWHRVVNPIDAWNADAARGGTAEARHMVLLGAFAIAVTAIARATGDLPYLLFMVIGGSNDGLFYGSLMALLVLIWVPVLYALAVYGLSLPRAAVTGEYGFRGIRAAMRYKRWPLVLALFALLAMAGRATNALRPLTYQYTDAALAHGAMNIVLCAAAAFVATTMYAVAYRDSN